MSGEVGAKRRRVTPKPRGSTRPARALAGLGETGVWGRSSSTETWGEAGGGSSATKLDSPLMAKDISSASAAAPESTDSTSGDDDASVKVVRKEMALPAEPPICEWVTCRQVELCAVCSKSRLP